MFGGFKSGKNKGNAMSLSKKLTLFIGLMALGTTSAWAACTRGPAPTVQLDMAMGRVVVNPDLPVGAVIATQNWTMPAGSGINYRCTGTTVFKASIVASGVTDLGNKVYSTNVPGIGKEDFSVRIIRLSISISSRNRLESSLFTISTSSAQCVRRFRRVLSNATVVAAEISL